MKRMHSQTNLEAVKSAGGCSPTASRPGSRRASKASSQPTKKRISSELKAVPMKKTKSSSSIQAQQRRKSLTLQAQGSQHHREEQWIGQHIFNHEQPDLITVYEPLDFLQL